MGMREQKTMQSTGNTAVADGHVPRSAFQVPRSTLAWCGWELPVPEDWSAMKITGGWMKGSMMIGRESEPIVLIKWWRPEHAHFNAKVWLDRRFGDLGVLADAEPALPAGFAEAGWVTHLENRDGSSKTVWYGYAPSANLVVEFISTSIVAQSLRDTVFSELLPTLRVSGADESVEWSLFSTRFVTPPGYRLNAHHLTLGDIALDLRKGKHTRLLVRQVFPAGLALERRPIDSWFAASPFMERRRMSRQATRLACPGHGVRQRGWKRLPAPLGWLKPRYCDRIATVDGGRDRLCIAELQEPKEFEAGLIEKTMGAMQS